MAINSHEFLVLERDNRTLKPTPPNAAQTPNLKRIYKIDLAKPGLTDVSEVKSLPATGAELAAQSIVPVTTKTLFIDLLDPSYMVNATRETIKDVIAEEDRRHHVGTGIERRPPGPVRLQRQRSLSRPADPDLRIRGRHGRREHHLSAAVVPALVSAVRQMLSAAGGFSGREYPPRFGPPRLC